MGQPLGGSQPQGRGSGGAGPTSDPTPASFLPPPQKERERDGGKESGVLWKGAEGGEGKKEKGTETWRSVVGTVAPRAAPRHRSSRSARGPRAPRSAVALSAGCAPGYPAARRRRRRGATGVPALPAEGAQAA